MGLIVGLIVCSINCEFDFSESTDSWWVFKFLSGLIVGFNFSEWIDSAFQGF